MATSTKAAGTCADDAGTGAVAWLNNSGLGGLGGTEAAADDNNNATQTIGSGDASHWLKCTNFGFSVPSGATIDGFEVKVIEKDSAIGGTPSATAVKMVKAGSVVGNDIGASGAWPTGSESEVTYGSPTEKGGQTWTDSDVNGSTFGCVVSVTTAAGMASPPLGPNLFVDRVQITVYYTEASGSELGLLTLECGI